MVNRESDVRIIYTTPETLCSNEDFKTNLQILHQGKFVERFVIDEAHCISLGVMILDLNIEITKYTRKLSRGTYWH